MSYTALYRKWRPKDFNDVIGQEHITKTLKNQIISNRTVHAYLFCGTRGTGKTSTAKIFAKAVNCIEAVQGEPCNKCDICKNIMQERSMNIIEIDAASNNGVDNIRQIIEEVKYPPTEGKYKVYIIDEVHMLSIGAFNALLKTLEEPPEHVIFILATTDPQKIPVTILSRCQRYDFKRISINDMTSKIVYYMEQEHVNIEQKAIKYIAKLSDGAMRDALSILDQCIAFYYGEDITLKKVLDTVGAVDSEVFYNFTNALIQKDSILCMNIIDNIVIQGRDIRQFVTEFIVHFRNLLIVKSSNTKDNILDLSQESIQKLSQQSENLSVNNIMNLIKEFSTLEAQLKYAGNDRILLEVITIKLCQKQIKIDNNNYDELLNRICILEENINKAMTTTSKILPSTENKNIKKQTPKAIPEDIKSSMDIWNVIKKQFKIPLSAVLEDTEPGYLDDNFYYIKCSNVVNAKYIEENFDEISKVLEEKTDKCFKLKVILKKDFEYKHKKLYGKDNDFENEDATILLNTLDLENVKVEQIE